MNPLIDQLLRYTQNNHTTRAAACDELTELLGLLWKFRRLGRGIGPVLTVYEKLLAIPESGDFTFEVVQPIIDRFWEMRPPSTNADRNLKAIMDLLYAGFLRNRDTPVESPGVGGQSPRAPKVELVRYQQPQPIIIPPQSVDPFGASGCPVSFATPEVETERFRTEKLREARDFRLVRPERTERTEQPKDQEDEEISVDESDEK